MDILDFHTHVGAIFPNYQDMSLTAPAAAPHYVMISSPSIVAHERIFYRKRPAWWSFGFVKHVLLTILLQKRTRQGMVLPNLLHDMQRHGIGKSVVLPIEYDDGLQRSAEVITQSHSFPEIIPFCSVHPADPQCIAKMQTYMEMGAKGLKLHPNFQQIRPDHKTVFDLCEAYSPYQRPLILHSGLTGREKKGKRHQTFSSVFAMQELPNAFPQMPIVFAHAGITQYQDAISLARQHENLFLEISGQPSRHIRKIIQAIGSERVLFGSDWPFWEQRFALHAVREATKGDPRAEQRILSENAHYLLA